MSFYQALNYECSCGEVKIQIKPSPLIRLFCHCSICKKISKQSYSDDILVIARDVIIENSASIVYKKHTAFFSLQRGRCKHCQSPVISFSSLIPFSQIAVTPTCFYSSNIELPKPEAHVFYPKQIKNSNDCLPKYSTYLSSQIATIKYIFTVLLKRFLYK